LQPVLDEDEQQLLLVPRRTDRSWDEDDTQSVGSVTGRAILHGVNLYHEDVCISYPHISHTHKGEVISIQD
jgi:hypothetical protein